MSDPVWQGGKDKNAFRVMSDKAGGTSGVRTVVQTQGDTTTTLRTRAGNPEVTTVKKGGRLRKLEESTYHLRKFHHERPDYKPYEDYRDDELSQEARYMKSFSTDDYGPVKFEKPRTLDESEELGWVEPEGSLFHEPIQIRSSDGIFAFTQYRPKEAKTSVGKITIDPIFDSPNDSTLELLELKREGFAQRTFYPPIAMETKPWDTLYDPGTRLDEVDAFMLMKYLVRPVKKLYAKFITGAVEIVFDKPKRKPATEDGTNYYTKNHYDFNTNYFDHIWGFGNPYHGTLDLLTGVFTTENGTEIFVPENGRWWSAPHGKPIDSGGALLFEFGKSYECSGSTLPQHFKDKGFSFKKYAIFSGANLQYSPMHKWHTIGERWLYQCEDGTTYAIRMFDGRSVRARRVKVQELPAAETGDMNESVHWTGGSKQDSLWGEVYNFGEGIGWVYNGSKDGKRAAGGWSQYGFDDGSEQPVLFTVSGGDFKTLPTVTAEKWASTYVSTPAVGDSFPQQGYHGGQMAADGTMLPIQWHRTFSSSGVGTALSVWTMVQTLSVGGLHTATLTTQHETSYTFDPYTSTGTRFKCAQLGVDEQDDAMVQRVLMYATFLNYGLVSVKYVKTQPTEVLLKQVLIGSLGQTLDITGRDPWDVYTQHPITGEILINKLPW